MLDLPLGQSVTSIFDSNIKKRAIQPIFVSGFVGRPAISEENARDSLPDENVKEESR